MRPVGMRPVGMRPVGMRPVGMRPVGMHYESHITQSLSHIPQTAKILSDPIRQNEPCHLYMVSMRLKTSLEIVVKCRSRDCFITEDYKETLCFLTRQKLPKVSEAGRYASSLIKSYPRLVRQDAMLPHSSETTQG